MSEDLTKLQIQLTHLERFVEQLNEVVTSQAETIDELSRKIRRVDESVVDLKAKLPDEPSAPEHEKPPHY